jgi:putative acetyltransferase
MKMKEYSTLLLLRIATPDDVPGIRRAVRSSIEGIAAKDYPEEVIRSWGADTEKSRDQQRRAILEGREKTWVAIQNGNIIGFAAYDPGNEELRAVYVAAEVSRLGIGTLLLDRVESQAKTFGISAFKMHSSITAAPFYKYHGYSVDNEIIHTLSTGVKMKAVSMSKKFKPEL